MTRGKERRTWIATAADLLESWKQSRSAEQKASASDSTEDEDNEDDDSEAGEEDDEDDEEEEAEEKASNSQWPQEAKTGPHGRA